MSSTESDSSQCNSQRSRYQTPRINRELHNIQTTNEKTQPKIHNYFLHNAKETNKKIMSKKMMVLKDQLGNPKEFRLYDDYQLGFTQQLQSILVHNSKQKDEDFPTDEEYASYAQQKCLSDLSKAIAKRQEQSKNN